MGDVEVPGRQLHSLHVYERARVRACLGKRKAADRESLLISSMSVGLLGDLRKTVFLPSLSLSFCPWLSFSLSPLWGFVMLMWRDVADS